MSALTTGNGKLKGSASDGIALVAAFSLPAQQTCPRAGECKRWCYASSGTFMFPSVKNHALENLALSQRPDFAEVIQAEIDSLKRKAAKKGGKLAVRLHDSGDFYDAVYTLAWKGIMENNKDVEFYAYTKSWKSVSEHLGSVANFTMIPSLGGLDDTELLESGFPFAYVFPVDGSPSVGSVEGSENDLENVASIKAGWNVGLRAHGARKNRVA
jgi:hypothetical protein